MQKRYRSPAGFVELPTRDPGPAATRRGSPAPNQQLRAPRRPRARPPSESASDKAEGASSCRAETSTNSPRAGIVPSRGGRRQLAERAAGDLSRGSWSARGRRPRSAPPAGRRESRSVAATRPGASNRTEPRSSAAIAASRSRRSRPDRGRNPSNDQRGPATPVADTAASTADAPGIGTTRPPSAGPRRDQLGARVADDRRPGIGHQRQVRAAAQVLDSAAVGRARCGRGSWSAARSMPCRSSSRCVSRVSSAAMSGTAASDLERPQGHVAEIADGRRDDVERPAAIAGARGPPSLPWPTPGRRRGYR